MGDLPTEILKRYGTRAVLVALAFAIAVWSLAHWTALPGSEVSVLWGLVKYTKRFAIDQSRPIGDAQVTQNEGERIAETTDSLTTGVTLLVRHGVTNENVEAVLRTLRENRRLRELTAAESGRTIAETPPDTYFFTLGAWLESSLEYDADTERLAHVFQFGRYSVSRYRTSASYAEVQHPAGQEPNLILFVDEVSAAAITELSGTQRHELMAAISPWGSMSTMLSLPVSRILQSRHRDVEVSENEEVDVLDLVIR